VAERITADVAVVGAGPAGIAAAAAAAEGRARVVLLDEGPRAGGQIWRHRPGSPPAEAVRWLVRLRSSGARVVSGASVVDAEPGFALVAEREGRALRVKADRVVVATGARERFLPFPGWTLPLSIGVGGAQALLKAGASFAGRRVIVAGTGPLLLPVAAALARDGARLALVAEQAPLAGLLRFAAGLWRVPRKLAQAAGYRAAFLATPYRTGVWVSAANGRDRVERATLTDGRRLWDVPCDVLCCGYGLVPNLELARRLGCAIEDGRVVVGDEQQASLAGAFCAGEPTGVGGVELALAEGEIAGLAAAGREVPAALRARRDRERPFVAALARAFAPRPGLRALPRPDTLVCRCEDVPRARLSDGWSARQAKLYTRAGMGACQGRVCGPALEFLTGCAADSVRPPLEPVALSTLEDLP
jgi:D-hydroxyproline dehydrogenase subunit alpha